MDKAALVEKQIEEGKVLISELDKANLEIKAAFWFYDENYSAWKLIIASSSKDLDVGKDVLSSYKTLTNTMRSISNLSSVSSNDIILVPIDHPLIKNIAPLIKTGSTLTDMRFSNTLLNNIYVEGMHLYRMNID